MPSTIQPRANSVTTRSWRSRTVACAGAGALAAGAAMAASDVAETTITAIIANSAPCGGSSAAASSPSTVPASVITPRAPDDVPHASRGTTSGSSA